MRLSPPKQTTFWVTVIIALFGLLGQIHVLAFLAPYSFWFVLIAFIVLALSLTVKGL